MYHRSIFADPDVRLLAGVIFADANFVPKSYLVAKKIYYVDKELYNYDITRPTQSMKQTDKRILNIVPVLEDMLAFYRKKGEFDRNRTQLMWYVARHCTAWVSKVKTLQGYSRIHALQEIFSVVDKNFKSDWIKSGIIEESFGRGVQKKIALARMFRYCPITWFWALIPRLQRVDRGIEKLLGLLACLSVSEAPPAAWLCWCLINRQKGILP